MRKATAARISRVGVLIGLILAFATVALASSPAGRAASCTNIAQSDGSNQKTCYLGRYWLSSTAFYDRYYTYNWSWYTERYVHKVWKNSGGWYVVGCQYFTTSWQFLSTSWCSNL